jgi:hypothetical protein
MRRLLATFALIAVASAAPLAAWCEARCAGEPDSASSAAVISHCHEDESGTDGPAVIADERCGNHDLVLAPAVVRNSNDTRVPAPAMLPVDVSQSLEITSRSLATPIVADTSPPAPTRNAVLRI